jgi:hypothetical protein
MPQKTQMTIFWTAQFENKCPVTAIFLKRRKNCQYFRRKSTVFVAFAAEREYYNSKMGIFGKK